MEAAAAAVTDATGVAVIFGAVAILKADGTISQIEHPLTPVPAPPAGAAFTQVAGEGTNFCGVRSDGTVSVWGDSSAAGAYNASLQSVPASATNVVQVACNSTYALALRADGTVVAWGQTGPHYNIQPLWALPVGLTGVAEISVSHSYAAARRADGTVVTWGDAPPPVLLAGTLSIGAAANTLWMVTADGDVVAEPPGTQAPLPAYPVREMITGALHEVIALSDMCIDIDECATGTAGCPANSTCTNTIGSVACDCDPGYVLNPGTGACDDIDECATGAHPCDLTTQLCVNTSGGVTCDCLPGFQQVNPLFNVSGFTGGMPSVALDVTSAALAFRLGIVALADGSAQVFGANATSGLIAGAASVTGAKQVAALGSSFGPRAAAVLKSDGTIEMWSSVAGAYGSVPTGGAPFVQLTGDTKFNFC